MKKALLVTSLISFLLMALLLAISGAQWLDEEKVLLNSSLVVNSDFKSMITYQQSLDQDYAIEEVIQNSDFTEGWNYWDFVGEAQILDVDQNKLVQLSQANSSNLISENCIKQNLNKVPHYLSFAYQEFSQESLLGFDAVSLVVLLNNQPIYLKPSEVTQGWQSEIIKLPRLECDELELKICAGNSGDRSESTWLWIDQISTQVIVQKPTENLWLKAKNPFWLIEACYQLDGVKSCEANPGQLTLNFSESFYPDTLQIMLADQEQLPIFEEEIKVFWMQSELDSPQDLMVEQINDNHYLLSFSNLGYKPNHNFQVKAASVPLDEEIWPTAETVLVKYPNLDLELLQPNCSEDRCLLPVEAASDSESAYFALRVCDVANNCSDISDSASAGDASVSKIVMNEIMFNPLGNDTAQGLEGEWIEIYNPLAYPVDVANWKLVDKANNEVILDKDNCLVKNNDSVINSTKIGSQNYLLVLMSEPILNNTGDELRLFSLSGNLIDEVIYTRSDLEGLSYGRYPNASDDWHFYLPATPLELNQPAN
jgi:hypothetical protein